MNSLLCIQLPEGPTNKQVIMSFVCVFAVLCMCRLLCAVEKYSICVLYLLLNTTQHLHATPTPVFLHV